MDELRVLVNVAKVLGATEFKVITEDGNVHSFKKYDDGIVDGDFTLEIYRKSQQLGFFGLGVDYAMDDRLALQIYDHSENDFCNKLMNILYTTV